MNQLYQTMTNIKQQMKIIIYTDTDTESESEHEENLPPDESNTNGPSQIAVESVESNKTFENYHNRSERIEPKINKNCHPILIKH